MVKKERMPKDNKNEREQTSKDLDYNPDITEHDKEILNNQSLDEQKGNYFKDRKKPIDFEGEDLDIPEMDEKQFNQTASQPDEATREKRPKDSANHNDNIESQSDTVYKGEKAENYKDPAKEEKKKK